MRRAVARASIVLLVLAVTIGCDQITKLDARRYLPGAGVRSIIGSYLVLVYTENSGAFLSLGARWPVAVRQALFIFISLAVLAVLIGLVLRSPQMRLSTIIALALVAGGGVSNVIDRILRGGRVVDFLNVGIGSVRTGIFNLADVAILAGVILLVALQLGPHRQRT